MRPLIAALGVLATASAAWSADDKWVVTTASEVRYFSWEGDQGFPAGTADTGRGSGHELYIPYAIQLIGQPSPDWRIEILGRGGWVWARQSTPGLKGEFDGITDTAVGTTVTYYGWRGIQPFVSLSMNLPTGESFLSPSETNARMDPDLVEIASFGEGFNIGPTAGVTIPINSNLIFTTSIGYTSRGEYDRDESLAATPETPPALTEVDPGEVLSVTASLGYQIGRVQLVVLGSFSQETKTTENDAPLYDPGDRYLINGTLSYSWMKAGVTTLNASAAHSRKNDVLFVDPSLNPIVFAEEPFNSNPDMVRVGLQHLFPCGQFWVGPVGSFLFRDENDYPPGTLQFSPERERWSAGALVRYAKSERLTLSGRIEHVWVHQEPKPGDAVNNTMTSLLVDPPTGSLVEAIPLPSLSSRGWQAAIGFNYRF